MTIEHFRAPVLAKDHLQVCLLEGQAQVFQSSNVDDMYVQEEQERARQKETLALRIEPECCRLIMHARKTDPNLPLPRPLPSSEEMRERAKLPFLQQNHLMVPFDPASERSPLEEKMNQPKAKRGFFAASQLHIPLTTAPVPVLTSTAQDVAKEVPASKEKMRHMKRALTTPKEPGNKKAKK